MKKFRYSDKEISDWCSTQTPVLFPRFASNPLAIPRSEVYRYAICLAEKAEKEDGYTFFARGTSYESESYRICVDLYARQVYNAIDCHFPEFLAYMEENLEDFYFVALIGSAPCSTFLNNEWKDWIRAEISSEYKELERISHFDGFSEADRVRLEQLSGMYEEYCR